MFFQQVNNIINVRDGWPLTQRDFKNFLLEKYGSVAGYNAAHHYETVINCNWKIFWENFLECYHCAASHSSLVTTHNWDYTLTASQKKRRGDKIAALLGEDSSEYRGTEAYGYNPFDGELNPQYLTGSLDGTQLAPLLPNIKKWTH